MSHFNSYHCHTTFCDGTATAEEMVRAAIAEGVPELGFSGHSYLPFDDEWTMTPESSKAYRETVLAVKEQYKDQISIRLGLEQDLCSPTEELSLYEYLIGGVHCVFKDGHYISVDLAAEEQRRGIEAYYGGDPYAFVEDYFDLVKNLYPKTGCQIIAHFDLVTKFIEKDPFINPKDTRYRKAAEGALEVLLEQPVVVEINTGAISRGYRTEPYPEEAILELLGKAQKPVLLSSDSHATDTITYGFSEAMHLVDRYHLRLFRNLDEVLEYTREV